MPRKYRPERIGEEIRRLISQMMRKDIRDPRLDGIVSISTVEVSPDHSYATVYISLLGDADSSEASDEQKKAALAACQSAKGLIRKAIGRELRLRHVPELTFKIDTAMEYGRHMDRLLMDLAIPQETVEPDAPEKEDPTDDD